MVSLSLCLRVLVRGTVMEERNLYWGDAHHNVRTTGEIDAFDEILREARKHLDFYPLAYYTAHAEGFPEAGHVFEVGGEHGINVESWKDPERLESEWRAIQKGTAEHYVPGAFVPFPGYEWQGDGSSGDHNVFHLREGNPIIRVRRLSELYEELRDVDALVIPHHVGYRPGRRGKDWSVHDGARSPFAEIFSLHGCSETDEEWIGLRTNERMGPGASGGTYQDALNRGYRLGAICSGDNWGPMPGVYGNGLMACYARELTREALWEAFKERRVYGVTGDRIRLEFTVNDAPMGSIVSGTGPRRIEVRAVGSDAIDRIELLRGDRVIATHCHQGTWGLPEPGHRVRFKLRVEAGWGPSHGTFDVPTRTWEGDVEAQGGRFLGFEPCWCDVGQGVPELGEDRARFTFCTPQRQKTLRWHNADVFEVEADPGDELTVRLNGLEETGTVRSFMTASRDVWYREECIELLRIRFGFEPERLPREDVYRLYGYKAKIHRAIPEAGYTATMEVEDDEPFEGEIHYRVRVEQRNGHRAWSSPIWIVWK